MIVCAGQSMIDCIVTEGRSASVAGSIVLCPGGEAFNEASALAVLGDSVVLSSAIGDDHAGSILRGELSKAGIELFSDGYTGLTPVSVLEVDSNGDRRSRISEIHYLGGYVPGLPETEDIAFVTMGSLFRPPFLDPAACLSFARRVKATGAYLLADTKLPKGTAPRLSDYADTLALLDYITPNEQEALYYTGCSRPEDAAEVFHSFGVRTVIIKLAGQGCFISSAGKYSGRSADQFRLPAFSVNVVDGIGAGDCFNAGLIHSLLCGRSLRGSAVFASACAAICVSGRGAVSALHSVSQVEAFLRAQGL